MSVQAVSKASATRSLPFPIDSAVALALQSASQSSFSWSDALVAAASFNWANASDPGVDLLFLGVGNTSGLRAPAAAPAMPSAYAGLLAARVAPAEDVSVSADLWLTTRGNTPQPLQKAIPVGAAAYFIPNGNGDSRPGQGGRLPNITVAYLRSILVGNYEVKGLAVAVTAAAWKLSGVPSDAVLAQYAAASISPPYGPFSPHTVTASTNSTSAVVPAGQLLPGYIYTASCDLQVAVSITTDYDVISLGVAPTTLVAAPASSTTPNPTKAPATTYGGSSRRQVEATNAISGTFTASTTASPRLPLDIAFAPATTLRSAILYVHAPPAGGRLTADPSNGTVLLTKFTASTSGWSNHSATRATSEPDPSAVLAWMAASYPMKPAALTATTTAMLSDLSSVRTAALQSWTGTSSGSGCSVPSSSRVAQPAWYLSSAALGARIGFIAEAMCSLVDAGGQQMTAALISTGSVIPAPKPASFTFSFRVDTSGVARERRNSLSSPVAAAAVQADLANPVAWYGTPLASLSSASNVTSTLPQGLGANDSLTLYVFVVDADGGVGWADARVAVRPALSAAQAADPVAVSGFVSQASQSITTASVQANPYSALLQVTTLGGLMANASSSFLPVGSGSAGGGGNTSGVNSSSVAAEVRANNTALKENLLAAVLTAVSSITATGSTGSSSGSANATNATLSNAQLATLLTDTSIKVDDGTVTAATSALNSLTADPVELNSASRTSALSAVENLLIFSLPNNVLSGAVDQVDSAKGNSGGSSGTGGGGNSSGTSSTDASGSSVTVSAPTVPPFPVVQAQNLLSVVLNVIASDDSLTLEDTSASDDAPDGDIVSAGAAPSPTASPSASSAPAAASASGSPAPPSPSPSPSANLTAAQSAIQQAIATADALRAKVSASLRSLSAALLRAATPGSAAVGIASGPSVAFVVLVSRARRMQAAASGNSSSLPSYCGPALSMTTARLDTAASGVNASALVMERPMVPCYASGVADRPDLVPAEVDPPSVLAPPAFLRSASTGSSVDINIVQNGRSPVSETSGFKNMRFSVSNTGSSALSTANDIFSDPATTASMVARSLSAPAVSKAAVSSGWMEHVWTAMVVDEDGHDSLPTTLRNASFDAEVRGFITYGLPTPRTSSRGRRLASSVPAGVAGSVQTAIAQSGSSAAASTIIKALNTPSQGLDTRVLSLNLQNRAGKKLDVTNAPALIYFTVPLRDPATGPAASLIQDAYVRLSYNLTCPMDGAAAAGGNVSALVWDADTPEYLLTSNSSGAVNTTYLNITYATTVSYLIRDPSSSTSASLYTQLTKGYSRNPAVRLVTSNVYTLQADCGPALGVRNVTCGPEYYGRDVTFNCPEIGLLPLCAYWNTDARRWSTAGCSVVNVTATAVTCACNHLTEFAARFAALADEQQDVFAHTLDLFEDGSLITRFPHVFIILGLIIMLSCFGVLVACVVDQRAAKRFYEHLLGDEEVQFLARIEELKGNVFILDRVLDRKKQDAEAIIKTARLDVEAKRMAEAEGRVYTRGLQKNKKITELERDEAMRRAFGKAAGIVEDDGAQMAGLNPMMVMANKRGGVRDIVGITNPNVIGRGARGSNTAGTQNPMLAAKPMAAATPNPAAAALSSHATALPAPSSALAMVPLSSIDTRRRKATRIGGPGAKVDPYTTAIYLRMIEAYDRYQVSLAEVKTMLAQGTISEVVAKQFGMTDKECKDVGDKISHVKSQATMGKLLASLPGQQAASDAAKGSIQPLAVTRSQAAASGHAGTVASNPKVVGRGGKAKMSAVLASVSDKAASASDTVARGGDAHTLRSAGASTVRSGHARMHALILSGAPSTVGKALEPTLDDVYGSSSRNAGKDEVDALSGMNPGVVQQRYESKLLMKAKEKMRKLDDTSSWSCVRLWRLRHFLLRLWVLRVWFSHVYLSIFTKYDPRMPRVNRTLLLCAILIGNMWATAFFYAFRHGQPGDKLPAITPVEMIVVAILSALLQLPVTIALNKLLQAAGEAEFSYRYPFVWSEIQRRRVAESRLARLSKKALELELTAGPGAAASGDGGSGSPEAPQWQGIIASTTASGATLPSAYLDTASKAGLLSPSAAAAGSAMKPADFAITSPMRNGGKTALQRSSSYHSGGARYVSAAEFDYGWVDAPPACNRHCGVVLRACNRHPSQKAAYIEVMAAEEAKQVAASIERKRRAAAARAAAKAAANGGAAPGLARRSSVRSITQDSPGSPSLSPSAVAVPGVGTLMTTTGLTSVFEGNDNTGSLSPRSSDDGPDVELDDEDDELSKELNGGAVSSGDISDLVAAMITGIAGACAGVCQRRARYTVAEGVDGASRRMLTGRPADTRNFVHKTNQAIISDVNDAVASITAKADDLLDEIDHSGSVKGKMRLVCRVLCPCTAMSAVAFAAVFVTMAWWLYYLLLFGISRPAEVTLSFTYAWLTSQGLVMTVLQPTVMLLATVWSFGIWPAWLPYILWIPYLGPFAAGRTAAALATGSALTGRMEQLTLVRAAGAASSLSPDAALIAYGAAAVVSAALSSTSAIAQRVAAVQQKVSQRRLGSGLASLTESQRHELIVRRYLMAQMRAAETAHRRTLAAAKRRAAAFSHEAAQSGVGAFRAAGLSAAVKLGGGGSGGGTTARSAASTAVTTYRSRGDDDDDDGPTDHVSPSAATRAKMMRAGKSFRVSDLDGFGPTAARGAGGRVEFGATNKMAHNTR